MLFRLFALLWCINLLTVTSAQALHFFVNPTTGDNRRSVQSAQNPATAFKTIAHALRIAHLVTQSRPHVITIAAGTYSLSSGELFPLEITQTGIYIETTGLTIFDGENKTNFFKITAPTSDFVIKGIDFINGSADKGGVVFCQTCSLRVVKNRFFKNKASQNGHVIYTENGRLKFYNNLVRDSGSGNDTLAVLELRNSSIDTLVRDEIRNNTFYRNPSPNIWASGARTYISSNIFIDPRQTAIRDADSTAAPLIGHNLFWETETLYVSDKGDSVNIVKATRDTLNFASAGISVPSFVTTIPDVRTLRFRGDTLSLADLNTRIPTFVKNNPDTLFKYQVGVGYQYLIDVDGIASQYGFKALTLPTGATLDTVSNVARLIIWNPGLNDTISHPISIEITPPSGVVDTLSYTLDILSAQSFPDTTGFLAVRDSTSRFVGMVKETSTIQVPHTAGQTYNYTIGVTGNRAQYFFNPSILPTGISSTKVSEEGVIEWATTLADTGSNEIRVEIIGPAGNNEKLNYKIFVFAAADFPDTTQTTQVVTTTITPDTTGAVTAINALVPSFSVAASAVGNIYANPTVLDTTVNRFELVTGSPAINSGTPVLALGETSEGFARSVSGIAVSFSEWINNNCANVSCAIVKPTNDAGGNALSQADFDSNVGGKRDSIRVVQFDLDSDGDVDNNDYATLPLVSTGPIDRNNIGNLGGPGNGGAPTPDTSFTEIKITTLPDSVVTQGQVFTYNPTIDPAIPIDLVDLIPGFGAPTMGVFTTFSKQPPITWTPTIADTGSYLIGVKIITSSNSGRHYFPLRIRPSNEIPTISSTPDTIALEDEAYSYAIQGVDANGDTLTYSLDSGPTGLTVDAATGLVQWTPTQANVGSDSVVVRINDGKGGLHIHRYFLTVLNTNDAPIISSTPDTTATEDSPFSYALVASDPDPADTLSYSLSTGPSGASVDSLGALTWTPTQTQIGTQQIALLVSDRNGGSTTQSFAVEVAAFDDLPVIAGSPDTTALEDQIYTFLLNASDEEGGALTYALTSGPEAMTLDTTGTLSWTPSQTDIGSHAVSVQVSDPAGQITSLSYQLVVQAVNDAPVINAQIPAEAQVRTTGGSEASFAVSATDEEGAALTFSWLLNDSLLVAADSSFSFVPGAATLDTLVARVSDGTNTTAFTWIIDGRQIPRITVDRALVDFGAVAIGDTARIELPVSNEGEATLNVSSLQVGDLHFAAVFAAISLGPNETTILALSHTPTGRSTSTDSISFATDDPDNPKVSIPVASRGIVPTTLSLDLDATAGDQALTASTVKVGSAFKLGLHALRTLDLLSYDLHLIFDPTALTFSSFTAQSDAENNLLAATGSSLTTISLIDADSVVFATIAADSLTTGISAAGLLGVFTFTADSSLAGAETSIRIEQALLKSTAATDTVGSGLAVIVSGRPAQPGDFDGDGDVDFDDFFLFADNFGLKADDATFDPLFDIAANGQIDFDDFFLFADNFGTAVGKLMPEAQALGPMALHLDKGLESPEILEVKPYWTGETPLRGYVLSIEFDPQILGFRQFQPRTVEASLPWVIEDQPGRLIFATGLASRQPAFANDLGTLIFDRLSPEQTYLRVHDAIGYSSGAISTLEPPTAMELMALPQTYALYPAHPNPFNPETTLPFYLPARGPIRLRIYDLLGQPIRTLVDESIPAGFHQRVWRGIDDRGQTVGSGLYLVEMQARDWRQIRKIMLLK